MRYAKYVSYGITTLVVVAQLLLSGSALLAYEQQPIVLDPNNALANNSKIGTMGNIEEGGGAVNTAALTINFLLGSLGILCLALLVYAAYIWLTAQGGDDDIAKARDIVKGTVLGLLVVLASYSFMYFMFRNLVNATD